MTELLKRINELAKKSREEGLTAEEKQEQLRLRQEYLAIIRGNLQSQLDRTYFVDDEGNEEKLKKKDELKS